MKIREATENDIDEIMNLYSDTVRNVNSKDYSADQVEVWANGAFRPEIWKQRIRDQYFIVAEENGTITGFSSIADDGYIDFMYIHKDFQRRGIARELLNEIERKGREQGNEELYSHVSKTARGFFEKYGYEFSGEEIDPVGNVIFINNIMKKRSIR